MAAYGKNGHPCPMCGTHVEPRKGPGAPRIYCCRECGLLNFHLDKVWEFLQDVLKRAGTAHKRELRSRLWMLGNVIRPFKGQRKRGTAYYRLELACLHWKEDRVRGRLVDGEWKADPVPRMVWCSHCRARKQVCTSEVRTA